VPNQFDRLDVYRAAISYVGRTRPLVLRLRKEDPTLADQLHRSVLSIPLNTAEGAGEFSPKDKARFYRYALRSCTETIAILDVCREIGLLRDNEYIECHELGDRLVAMLTRLVIVTSERDRDRERVRKGERKA
jgi:four helix bundle protein